MITKQGNVFSLFLVNDTIKLAENFTGWSLHTLDSYFSTDAFTNIVIKVDSGFKWTLLLLETIKAYWLKRRAVNQMVRFRTIYYSKENFYMVSPQTVFAWTLLQHISNWSDRWCDITVSNPWHWMILLVSKFKICFQK